jgi:hypothetical protein
MKNFLELLDTRHHIDICIEMSPVFDIQEPVIQASVNSTVLFNGTVHAPMIFNYTSALTDCLCIEFQLRDKKYSAEHETAVIIQSINIDGIELIPKHVNKSVYINDHDHTQPTNYMGFNGVWRLDIDRPFYQWLHVATAQGWLLEP